jgi:hypothetical protein
MASTQTPEYVYEPLNESASEIRLPILEPALHADDEIK